MEIGSLAGERSMHEPLEVMGAAPRASKRRSRLCLVTPAPAQEERKCRIRDSKASVSEFAFNATEE